VNNINNLRKRGAKNIFSKKNTMQQVPKNKYQSLLADPPEIDISKISEDAD
jgi:hypothetical protein